MVDYDLRPDEFRVLLRTLDDTVLDLPTRVMDAVTAGEELAAALGRSMCEPAVRVVVEQALRPDLMHITVDCENVVGAGHEVYAALTAGDERMAGDAIRQAVH